MPGKNYFKNDEWLRAIFDNTHLAVLLVNDESRYVQVNSGAVNMLGYSKEEFLNLSIQDIVTEAISNADESGVWDQFKKSKSRYQGEISLIKKDGNIIYCNYESTANILPGLHLSILTDISQQKKLKDIIAAEQLRFQKMFIEAPVSMCILKGRQLVFDTANNGYYKLTGRTKDIIGMAVRDAFPEVEGQGYFDWLDKVYETGETFSSNETPLLLDMNGDGKLTEQFISFMYQPYRNESGNVEGIFFFGVDVTEQVLARKKIEESEKRYIELMQNLPVAIYTTDAKGIIKLYNKAAVELWGRIPEEGKDKWSGAWKILDLDGNEILHEHSTMAETIKTGKEVIGKKIMVETPTGEIRFVDPQPALIKNSQGEITGGVNVLIDVTEKRKTEEELRRLSLIAQKTDNAVIITNPQGNIEWVNEGFTKNTEILYSEAIGKRTADLLHGKKTDNKTRNFIFEKMKKNQAFECEILKYKKSGVPFWVEIKGQPIFDVKGNLIYYFEIESDITNRKEAYERLVTAEEQARKFAGQLNNILEEERARIAREIHDEFGQQLSGLKMSLTFLKKISSGSKQINDLTDSMKQDIDATLQSLREFATELRPGILDTLGLTESLEWLVKEFEKKSGIRSSFSTNMHNEEFDKNLAISIFRICQEALTNVLKHSAANKVTIKFDKYNNGICLTISDNGKGISSENMNNPFSMGLLGMRERAKLIKGELKITGESGTTIHLIINNDEEITDS